MCKLTQGSFCIRTLAVVALAGFAPAAAAQMQGVSYDGEVTGSIGEMAYQGRIPAPNPPNAEIPGGAHFTVEQEGQQRFIRVLVTALGSQAPARRGPDGYYGDNAVRIEMGFAVPASASDSDLTQDLLEFASLSFVEVWPSRVRAPALQYNTMFNQPDLSLATLEWSDDGIRLEGSISGEACLHFYDVDDHGNRTPTGARVMGETVCPSVALEFSALATPFEG
ncbi:MAG: hypothetical protein ACXIVL_07790 [Oceanicaulis sp.]